MATGNGQISTPMNSNSKSIVLCWFLSIVLLSFVFAVQDGERQGAIELEGWNTAKAEWHQLTDSGEQLSSEQVISAYTRIKEEWEQLDSYWKDGGPGTGYFRIAAAIKAAEMMSNLGKFDQAAGILKEGANLAERNGFGFSRGRSTQRFQELASLHVRLFSALGANPLDGVDIGYELWRDGAGFAAVQERQKFEKSSFQFPHNGVIQEEESEAEWLEIDALGMVTKSAPAALTVGDVSLRDRVAAVFEFQPSGSHGAAKYVRTSLQQNEKPDGKIETNDGGELKATLEDTSTNTNWFLWILIGLAVTGFVLLWYRFKSSKTKL